MAEQLKLIAGFEISPFGLPRSPGVYAVYTFNQLTKNLSLEYIGSSNNMAKRVYNHSHQYSKLNDSKGEFEYICVAFCETKDYIKMEIDLIKEYKPRLNIAHNN